jgi:hypothetical protein
VSDALEPNVEAAMGASPRSDSQPMLAGAVIGRLGPSKHHGRPAKDRIEEAEMTPIGFVEGLGKMGGSGVPRIRRGSDGAAKATVAVARSGDLG